jgi:dTDP-4-dehydrorhamnose reductase
MKIVVLGGRGMLGHKIFHSLLKDHPETVCTVSGRLNRERYNSIGLFQSGQVIEHVNAMDTGEMRSLLEQIRPHFVINCIGVIKQRPEARAALPSIQINSLLPHQLALWTASWGGRVIHFSTDCVFSGRRGGYTEASFSDAEDLYGRSKFLGELAEDNAVTLRTSIIGRELDHFASLLEWFLRNPSTTVSGYTRSIYSGVTTNELSRIVGDIISRKPELSGVFQVASEPISKYELLLKIRKAFARTTEIVPDDREKIDRSMSGAKFHDATGYTAPGWDDLVNDLASDPVPYELLPPARSDSNEV